MIKTSIAAKQLTLYGAIALPLSFAGFPLYVLAPDFYATHHGLSLTLLGTLLLAIRLFDAVQDPIIGWLADKWQHKFFPFVLGSGLSLCVAIFALFNMVVLNPAIWFVLCLIVAVSAYSIISIILGSYATLWTDDKNDQTRIAGAREAFGLIGIIIAVSVPSVLAHIIAPESVYIWYSGILLLLMAIGIICFSNLPGIFLPPDQRAAMAPADLRSGLQSVSPFGKRIFAIYGISMLASSIPAVLVIFYVRDLLFAEHILGLFLFLYFFSGAIGMPVWKRLSSHYGKCRAWAFSNLLAVAGFIGAFFLGAGDVWAYGLVCIVSGLALGADLTLPPSILADDIHSNGNSRFSGTQYAILAFLSKASLAVASAIALPMLDWTGFIPQAANSKQALFALSAAYALVPCILKIISAGLLYRLSIQFNSGVLHENIKDYGNHRSSFHA